MHHRQAGVHQCTMGNQVYTSALRASRTRETEKDHLTHEGWDLRDEGRDDGLVPEHGDHVHEGVGGPDANPQQHVRDGNLNMNKYQLSQLYLFTFYLQFDPRKKSLSIYI